MTAEQDSAASRPESNADLVAMIWASQAASLREQLPDWMQPISADCLAICAALLTVPHAEKIADTIKAATLDSMADDTDCGNVLRPDFNGGGHVG